MERLAIIVLLGAMAGCGSSDKGTSGTNDAGAADGAALTTPTDAGVADSGIASDSGAPTTGGTQTVKPVTSFTFEASGPQTIAFNGTALAGDLLVLAIASEADGEPTTPVTGTASWQRVARSATNANLTVWTLTAAGGEASVKVDNGSTTLAYLILMSEWANVTSPGQSGEQGLTSTTVAGPGFEATGNVLNLGFSAVKELAIVAPDAPFAPLTTQLHTGKTTLLGGYGFFADGAHHGATWEVPTSAGWDAITLVFDAK